MAGIQTGLTDAQLLASQLKAHELVGQDLATKEDLNTIVLDSGNVTPEQAITIDSLKGLLTVGKNKIDEASLISGKYVISTTGNIGTSASFSHTDFIELEANTQYTLSVVSGATQQFALYDSSYVFIVGYVAGGTKYTFATPSNVSYGRFTIYNVSTGNMLELGGEKTTYLTYSESIEVSKIEKEALTADYFSTNIKSQLGLKTIVTVGVDKDFQNLRDAVESITDNSAYKQYDILLDEGTYDVLADYTESEINATTFHGLPLKNYVSLKGIGSKANTIVKGEISSSYSLTTITRVSTISKEGEGEYENITVTAKNLRYAIHDDARYPNTTKKHTNCSFIHYDYDGEGTVAQAYGIGAYSGQKYLLYSCYCTTYCKLGKAFYIHNSSTQSNPIELIAYDSEFDSIDSFYCIEIESIGSGNEDIAKFYNCKFNGRINVKGTNEFKISGNGNDVVPVLISDLSSNYNFSGEHVKLVNKGITPILKGDVVKRNSSGLGIEKMGTTDNSTLFYGIAEEDIASDENGIIRISGFLSTSSLGLSGLSIGAKIGVVNGELSIVTTDNYIGTYCLSNFILLKR